MRVIKRYFFTRCDKEILITPHERYGLVFYPFKEKTEKSEKFLQF